MQDVNEKQKRNNKKDTYKMYIYVLKAEVEIEGKRE